MKFSEAYKLMEKGEKITLPDSKVYWKLVDDRVEAYDIFSNEFDHIVTTYHIICGGALEDDRWVVIHNNKESKGFGFGIALDKLKKGLKVSRKGWNGKNMYVYYEQPRYKVNVSRINNDIYNPESDYETYEGYFVLRYADRSFAVWTPSIMDLLAEDWYEVVCIDINNSSTAK